MKPGRLAIAFGAMCLAIHMLNKIGEGFGLWI